MRIMKSTKSYTPLSTGLSGTQFSTLKSPGLNDPEGPEKYNSHETIYTGRHKDIFNLPF
jgi:hypothetical protein